MAEPFVFHFRSGPGARPEVLYILDLDCQCPLCGHEQFQRFYHSTPFHSLTLVGLDELADRAPLKAGYKCENCGDAVGANDVRHSVLAYGFCDDAGIIRIFDDLVDNKRTYEITARHRLDPQAQPRWKPDPDAHRRDHFVVDDLRESHVTSLLERPFNAKLDIRDALEAALEEPSGSRSTRICPDMWLVASDSLVSASEVVEVCEDSEFANAYAADDLEAFELVDSEPVGLVTHDDAASIVGRWSTWLPEATVEALREHELRAVAFLRRSVAIEIIERTFEVARLDYRRVESDGDLRFEAITTPTEVVYHGELSTTAVLSRAVFTGLTPGEAARLTAEEIVGELLQVW